MVNSHLSPRWRKILRDLWINKTRTALVVLSLAVGVFTISFLMNASSLLRTKFESDFAAVNSSSATLIIPEGFDQDFVQAVRRMPGIEQAEGRRSVTVRLQVRTNQWINLNLSGIDDFGDIRIDKVRPYGGAWPPPKGEVLLERSSLRLAVIPDLTIGDELTIQAPNGTERTLKFAGVALDFNRTPSPGTGVAYGFATLETLERLGEPTDMNDLRIVVAQNKLDKEHIRQVANQIKAKVEKDGRTVGSIVVPDPGQHPLGTVLDSLGIILGTLSVLTLVGGAFLVVNTVVALLAQQIRQIGMMKAVGARVDQLVAMYLGMVLLFGILALAIATPLAIVTGVQFARFLGGMFNLDLNAVQIPIQVFAVEALIGFGVPLLAALYPIWSGTRVTVRAALADYGLSIKGEGRRTLAPNSPAKVPRGLRDKCGVKDERNACNLSSALSPHPSSFLSRPLRLSLRNTFRRRARLVFTLLPLALSGAIFISVINLRTSLQSELEDIFAYRRYNTEVSFERPYRLDKIAAAALKVPGVVRVEGYHETRDAYVRRESNARIRADETSRTDPKSRGDESQENNLVVSGVSPATDMFRLPVIAGRWLESQDENGVVMNDALRQDEPDMRVGDQVSFRINGRKMDLQIVGIVREKMAPDRIYMNDSYFTKMLGNAGRTNRLWVVTDLSEPPEATARALENQFEQAGLTLASITSSSTQREAIDFHFNIMVIPLGIAALLLALVGGLGLMGTMSTNVIERRREIGVMRAIGASDRGVRQIFVVEGLFIGLISWLISVVGALPVTYLLDDMVGMRFLKAPLLYAFPPSGVVAWLVIVVVTVVLSCYVPAQQAAQTSVRELLAYE